MIGSRTTGATFRHLDEFIARQPASLALVGLPVGTNGKGSGRRFFEALDRLIRSCRVDETFEQTVGAMAALRVDVQRFAEFIEAVTADAKVMTALRTARGRRASLWGVTPIINLIPCARADLLAGSDACSLVFNTYKISAEFDLVLEPQSEWVSQNMPRQLADYRWLVFVWAILRIDNFFLFNDQGIIIPVGGYGSANFGISLIELDLLSRAGKAIYTLAYGADHRSRAKTLALGRYNFCSECPDVGRYCICDDAQANAMLAKIDEYSTANLTTGLSTYYIPNAVNLNYLVVDTAHYAVAPVPAPSGRPLRVLHCPNHQHFKGTHYLEAAVARLQHAGVDIELRLIAGVSNREIREEMLEADLVADQFLGGMFGYTAVEAMAMGRPVLCYLAHPDLVPDAATCPVIKATPDDLYEVLARLVADRDCLAEIGTRSRRYVEAQFSLEAFSRRLHELYATTIPGYEAGRAVATGGPVVKALERVLGVAGPGSVVRGTLIGAPSAPRPLDGVRSFIVRYPLLRALARAVMRGRVARQLCDAARSAGRAVGTLRTWLTPIALRVRRTGRRALAVGPVAVADRLVAGAIPVGRALTWLRLWRGRPRSLWGITPIITLGVLARCDRSLGFASESFVFNTYGVTSNFDVNLGRITAWVVEKHPAQYAVYTKLVLAFALLRYDVFHYYFDRGVEVPLNRMGLNERELLALERAGKRLFVYTYGADVRTREQTLALGKYNFCTECPEPGKYCICDEARGRANTALVARYATAMLAMGDMCAYVPGHREMHFWPLDLSRIEYRGARASADGMLRVAHATNQPWFKGTAHLVATVERLREEGLPIELVSMSRLPNTEVLRLLGDVDVVAEQFLGGFHGYTALEAMAVGKPVISYIRDWERLADAEHCPIVSAQPEELEDVLRRFVAGHYDFEDLGRRGRAYVESYYGVDAVARELACVYLECAAFPPNVERKLRRKVV